MNATYTLPTILAERIEAMVRAQGETLDNVALRLWTDYLDDLEDYHYALEASERRHAGETPLTHEAFWGDEAWQP